MPALYGITGSGNSVPVSNTTGLYIGSGNVTILNNAQTLYSLLSNSSTVNFELINNNQNVTAIVPSGTSLSLYSITFPNAPSLTAITGESYGLQVQTPGQLFVNTGDFSLEGVYESAIFTGNNEVIIGGAASGNYGVKIGTGLSSPTYFWNFDTSGNLTLPTNLSGIFYANGVNILNTVAGTYGNTQVAAYLASNTDPTISNLNANTHQVQTQFVNVNSNVQTISANLGSFETYANIHYVNTASAYGNSNVATYLASNTDPTIIGINANLITANTQMTFYVNSQISNVTTNWTANAAAQEGEISGLRSNITAANASIQTLNANVGSFYTYANATYATNANLASTNANLAAFETYANLTFGTSNYANANVLALLSSGTVTTINTSGNITTTANMVASGNFYGNLIAANIVVANIGIQNYTSYGSVGSPTYNAGVLWYDNVQDSIAYYSSIANNEVNVGQELQFNAWNGTGSQINQGVPVYLTGGSLNNLPNIAPAQANTISTSQIAGVANQNIPANTKGAVVTIGVVANVAMGSFSVGDTLYLSPYSAGQIQNTQPPTGYVVKVGTVLYNNSPNGRFLVNKTVPVNNQYFGNLTVTGVTTTGNLTTTNGVYWANGVSYGSTFASSYGNANVASYLASGTDATINAINSNVTAANTAISTLQVAPIFVGNLAGNVLYDGIYKRANIQAYPINYIQNQTTSYYQSSFLNSGNPVYDASNLLYANATVSGTTQANVTLRTAASPPQQTFGFQEQFQVFAANTSMVNGDRVRGMGSSLEIFTKPNGTVNGVWSNYVAFTGTQYPSFSQQNASQTPVLAAHQAYMGISGTGNVYTAAGLYVSSTLNPSNGNINMNIQQGLSIGLGWVGAIGQTSQTAGKIDVIRGINVSAARGATTGGANATVAALQTIVHAQGMYFQANWHTTGNLGATPTGMIRSIQNEDPLTELYNAGNVIIGGNLIQTGSANTVTFSGPTIVNNSVTINGATSLLQVTTYTVTALNAITGVSGQVAAVSNGTAKNGGQLAYWDTTNARWSWFDTNLAVS